MNDLHLSVFHGPGTSPTSRVALAVGQTLVFGRSPVPQTDVCLPLNAIERRHFEVRRDEVAVWVRDLDTRGGTLVNDLRLHRGEATCRLFLDDVIRVCDVRVRLGATVPIDPAWVNWNDGVVLKIAQFIADAGAFDRLPTLADALNEAGCNDADLLAHCRTPCPHLRGCWVVDLLLGKA